jgi:hypothetical protein
MDPEKEFSGAEERMVMQENEKSGEVVHVPTSVCLLLNISSYIMLGTLLFDLSLIAMCFNLVQKDVKANC